MVEERRCVEWQNSSVLMLLFVHRAAVVFYWRICQSEIYYRLSGSFIQASCFILTRILCRVFFVVEMHEILAGRDT
jgi:hypothetical protein